MPCVLGVFVVVLCVDKKRCPVVPGSYSCTLRVPRTLPLCLILAVRRESRDLQPNNVGRGWALKPRRIPPEIRSGRGRARGPRRIPPEGLPVCASRLPSSDVGASFPPPLDRGGRARPASATL